MSSITPPLTKEDFINSGWQEVIDNSERKECSSYDFWQKSQEAKEAEDIRKHLVFGLLHSVTSAYIKPESTEEHFAKTFQYLTEEHLNFFTEIVPEVSDPELQARIADILWVKKRNYQMAQLAVEAYLKSAKELEDPEKWTWCVDRIERAFRLARKINYKFEVIFAYIEEVLDRYKGEDPKWLSVKLMELLLEYRLGDPKKYATLAEKAAQLAESNHDWRRARNHWEIKAQWHLIEKDGKEERKAQMQAAETYVTEANDALKRNPPSYLVASHFMQKAIEAFRKVRGTKEETIDAKNRAEEVHKLLLQYQEKSGSELIAVSHKGVDISVEAEQARSQVRGREFQDALFTLALLGSPPKVSQLKQQVQQMARDHVLSDLFPGVIINDKGKVVAQQLGSVLSNNPEESEKATLFEMYKNAALFYQPFHAQAYIEHARYQITLEHSIRVDDLLPIVSHSPFVPQGREYLFAKGLYAGLTGDFFTSTHILIPQIENSIRELLWQMQGVITSKLDNGIQNEYDLNKMLYRPEITSIFDEDTLFDLKGLLIEHAGSNLRNRMAHGLINDYEFSSSIMSYLWWVTLRLCCLPIIIHQQKSKEFNPWVEFDGIFKDDPLFDDFVENMAANRRELDAEMAAYEASLEENQSA
ncbi:MAG TPA: DUF4209 domain-containing protein [Nostocaceae cyanobacterium]|nr:DUF4209 domain-containing protein [Nostocaceae cyanobacterium]